MNLLIVFLSYLFVFNLYAQPLRPEGTVEYVESIVLNCQANLSSLYQERAEMVEEMEKGKQQALQSLSKLGLKNPDVNLEKIPPVLSEKLDLEHAKAMEKSDDEFLVWESRFFMTNASDYIKECLTKTIEIHKSCSTNKKKSKDCLAKNMSSLNEMAKKHIPFLKFLEENSIDKKKSNKGFKKKIQKK
jgi:hypothetical protein